MKQMLKTNGAWEPGVANEPCAAELRLPPFSVFNATLTLTVGK